MGPPESPEHESLPPAVRPAQNMLVVMAEVPYCDWQVAREMTGTETFLRLAGRVVPSSVRRPLFLMRVSDFHSSKRVISRRYFGRCVLLTSRRR